MVAMSSPTNVAAEAVRTAEWLSASTSTIAVPVYQRRYRWEIAGCAQLLEDIRTVADAPEGTTHFIGSILSSAPDATGERVLIDGQQRLTTLMLLVAALEHAVRPDDEAASRELARILVHADGTTKLRPHQAWAEIFDAVVLDRPLPETGVDRSRFEENYTYFRSQIGRADVERVRRGLERLEHVAIELGAGANAQQIFESLNSTGTPLRDHELIHNYVLMGLTHAQQQEVEAAYWAPIERATGDSIDPFFRDYLVLRTGREIPAAPRAVYDAFHATFPRLDPEDLGADAAEWLEYAGIYRRLLDPSEVEDRELRGRLEGLTSLGRSMRPLAMLALHDHARGRIAAAELDETLDRIEALLIRRLVVGQSDQRLVARLCRSWVDDRAGLPAALGRITPSDERVRLALFYRDLPYPGYVLSRLEGIPGAGLDVEHVFPVNPRTEWSGDGVRTWSSLSDDEQHSLRALRHTIGNLALLERDLAEAASGRSFADKRRVAYSSSAVPGTRALAGTEAWGSTAITERTKELATAFIARWPRAATVAIDDDGLTPILDVPRRPGWYEGWRDEFEYVDYRGEHWEVYDIKALLRRVTKRLWTDRPDDVLAYSAANGGPVYDAQAWNGEWERLGETDWLFVGQVPQYALRDLQGLLEHCGLAAEVFVKYPY
jgi:hypothetical protein